MIEPQHPLRREVALLFRAAMVVFVWTVGIGILNGSDAVDFDRKVVLSHVHAGTLGWIAFTYEEPRAIIGGVALAAIVAMFVWVVARFRHIEPTTVHLAVLAAIATSVAGRGDRRPAGPGSTTPSLGVSILAGLADRALATRPPGRRAGPVVAT